MKELSRADIIEALIFASEQPLTVAKMAEVAGVATAEALEELEVLREEKLRLGSLQLIEVAGGWQFVTKPEFAPYVRRLRDVPRQRLSRAAFEVLAVVAYRQPVTRGEIEELRGVDCSGPLQFLLERKLLGPGGRRETPGRPWLYLTTPRFLDHFGLRSIDDLPSLDELVSLNDGGEGGQGRLFARGEMAAAGEAGEEAVLDLDAGALAVTDEGQTVESHAPPHIEVETPDGGETHH